MKDNIKINNDGYDYIEIDKADLNNYIEMLNKSDKKVEDLYISESSFKTDTYNVYIKYKKESEDKSNGWWIRYFRRT